jgi:hypothetical protein
MREQVTVFAAPGQGAFHPAAIFTRKAAGFLSAAFSLG